MQQSKQQFESKSEHIETKDPTAAGNDEYQFTTDTAMQFNDNTNNHINTPSRDNYGGMSEWLLSPGVAVPSPVKSSKTISSGYTHGIGATGMPVINMAEGNPTSLAREEQVADASYTMPPSRRNHKSTASASGKISEPHYNDM